MFLYLPQALPDMHRIAIHFRFDQYQWLLQQKCPGKSISHCIRDLVDAALAKADLADPSAAAEAGAACDVQTV